MFEFKLPKLPPFLETDSQDAPGDPVSIPSDLQSSDTKPSIPVTLDAAKMDEKPNSLVAHSRPPLPDFLKKLIAEQAKVPVWKPTKR